MLRPRVKEEHRPQRFPDGTIWIGGGIYGIAAEVDDPYGLAWAVLRLMDGTHTPQQIAALVRDAFGAASPGPGAVEATIDALIASGYVEDAAAGPPPQLTARELDRYHRSHAFFRRVDLLPREHGWVGQLALKHARVVVLGVGGTGSHAAWALAASGVGTLHLVDPDRIELSNLNRQILFTESDIGRPKAQVAARRLAEVNSDIAVTYSVAEVGGQDDVAELVADCDVLALCADRPKGPESIRVWVNRACAAAGVPWVGGGYDGPFVTVGVYTPSAGACYECLVAGEEKIRRPGLRLDHGGPGVIAPSAGLSGQLVAYNVIALITGVSDPVPGALRGLNLVAPDEHVFVTHPPRPDCPVCSGKGRPAPGSGHRAAT
jgi:molybdopterin/thiamine biosynthesis adenylyltransferase